MRILEPSNTASIAISNQEQLMNAIKAESTQFHDYYLWLERNMPTAFFKEMLPENIMLIVHNLMGLHLQDYFSQIILPRSAIILCCNSADADLRILKNYRMHGIKVYRTFVSTQPLDIKDSTERLRIGIIYFTEAKESRKKAYPSKSKEKLKKLLLERNKDITEKDFNLLINNINTKFLHSLPIERLSLALDMFFRAQTRNRCQYDVQYNKTWEKNNLPSMQIVLAWRNTPKYDFLYRMARVINRHNLVMQRVNATYVNPYKTQNTLIMSLTLHGSDGRSVWESANTQDFLRELVLFKYFDDFDKIDEAFTSTRIINGNLSNLLRSMSTFIHQALVHVDPNLYSADTITADLCRHPELTVALVELFELKFNPDKVNMLEYKKKSEKLITTIEKLDSGNIKNDMRRKEVLSQSLNFIDNILKTNFYLGNKTTLSFRLDPSYLNTIPFDRSSKFPELPYSVFFITGMQFFGFHIRFKNLSRGGLRTIFPEKTEQMLTERDTVFTECYNLAYTQHKKNKDIPEGGAKGVIFLKPLERMNSEAAILSTELNESGISKKKIDIELEAFYHDQRKEYLSQAQKSFVNGLLTLINYKENNLLKAENIIDYWKKPEYIYLGPDENMSNDVIEWIATTSREKKYISGSAFITSKPGMGINHKEYGVTSLGVNTYMHEILKYIGINPEKDVFTVKMTGGPDGDVAGNQIYNLYRLYRKTAKIVALTDGSGTINDAQGLDLDILVALFRKGHPIKYYPPEKLSEGGFLLDKNKKREKAALVQQTLCWRKEDNKVIEDWISGSEMHWLLGHNVHKTIADIFITGGGRPRTLYDGNYRDYLTELGTPTSKAIIEGANLYITPLARKELEKLGVLIVEDSSANKTGVMGSSFEVLCSLTLSDEEFMANKKNLVNEVLGILQKAAHDEAQLLIRTHIKTGKPMTEISKMISDKINSYMYKLLDYFEKINLPDDPNSPPIRCFLNYCPPTLRNKYQERLLKSIPDFHKKAIISSRIGSQIVYQWGLEWSPTIIDILPLIWGDNKITGK